MRLIIFTLLLLLSACSSTTQTAYRNLDSIIWWQISDLVDWQVSQEEIIDKAIDTHLQWHQQTQLPRYAKWLTQLHTELQQPLQAAQVVSYLDDLQAFYNTMQKQVADDTVTVLLSLNQEQMAQLFATMKVRGEERLADIQASRQTPEDMCEVIQARFERLLPDLNKQQLDIIAQWQPKLVDTTEAWFAAADLTRNEIRSLLIRYPYGNQAFIRDRLASLVFAPTVKHGQHLQTNHRHNQMIYAQMLASIINSFDEDQRAELLATIDDYRADIDGLIEQ